MSVVRVREHVNPLSQKYQTPVAPPCWQNLYLQPDQPLHLDIGCGKGRFLLQMAQQTPGWNFLGLEIREPLVQQANLWRDDLHLGNLHYLFCNANTSLEGVLQVCPAGVLQRVTIQFPDPWFKRRHQKRRVVQADMVALIAQHLAIGGSLFLQSDVLEVAAEMRDRFAACPALHGQDNTAWLSENPLPVATERETSTLERGEPVYRCLFIKRSSECSAV
ncbi:tRNA (guanosine(46)-N7)-methyltransferase TrmB [Leptolyngbya sp. 'hensonii']|uniref:tRNA (guanosine(46)-N7)-methyltransferase TrmB n=1 Tax=Leptolyngbya sp. 'hensonii' TaxID=1922337 RepID=UPI00094FA7CB|nr:tRNA (guanosine(46)-N7)-methyltransferase TrmB [Leptolyngbya sp. 'hensonii']OLP18859.1 tRNA (guanosine(46)-N7)-methyltransferase TrmB [Leptolyngbya sp. 'hensonii']